MKLFVQVLHLKPILNRDYFKMKLENFLRKSYLSLTLGQILTSQDFLRDDFMMENVEKITFESSSEHSNDLVVQLLQSDVELEIYPYELNDEVGELATETSLFTETTLPSRELEGLWERYDKRSAADLYISLVYEEDLKNSMLHYMQSALLFSDAGVDQNLIGRNII
jgi:hypothetical protein